METAFPFFMCQARFLCSGNMPLLVVVGKVIFCRISGTSMNEGTGADKEILRETKEH